MSRQPSGFVREKQMLVDLFKRCGKVELAFLVNSGLGFGMALGLVQMLAWLVYERAWTLAAGGCLRRAAPEPSLPATAHPPLLSPQRSRAPGWWQRPSPTRPRRTRSGSRAAAARR